MTDCSEAAPDFATRREMRAAYPEGPPAYYAVGPAGEILPEPPAVFCREECLAEWRAVAGRPAGLAMHRAWRFVRGVPRCGQCHRRLFAAG